MTTTKFVPLVAERTFLGLAWGCVAVSFLFLAFRLYVRLRVFRRLFSDDALIILAWLILLTSVILLLINRSLALIYIAYRVADDDIEPPVYLLQHATTWNHILLAETYLHLCGLWAVKFSFLAFFRRLGYHVKGQKTIWWSVSILTVAGFVISVCVLLSPCGPGRETGSGCDQITAVASLRRALRTQVGCDFSTDFLIMLIPINPLWKVQISLRQKAAILALFSLTIITMILAIIRGALGLRGARDDMTWFFLCTTIELTTGILVACLVSYRSLFTSQPKSRPLKTVAVRTLPYSEISKQGLPYIGATAAVDMDREGSEKSLVNHPRNEIMELKRIHVRNENQD